MLTEGTINQPKKSFWQTYKILLISLLVVVSLIAGGLTFWWWKKPKNQGSDEEEEQVEWQEEELEFERGKNFDYAGYSEYTPSTPATNISTAVAKKEVCKYLWKRHGENLPNCKEVEKLLLDVNSKMDARGRKLGEKMNDRKLIEELGARYQKKIFGTLPKQAGFEKGLSKAKDWFFFAGWNSGSNIEHRANGQIDWKETLKIMTGTKKNNSPGREENSSVEQLREEIKKQINPFFLVHGDKFTHLTNLDQLNQWANLEAQKRDLVVTLLSNLHNKSKKNGQKLYNKRVSFADSSGKALVYQNKKLGLTYKPYFYEITDKK